MAEEKINMEEMPLLEYIWRNDYQIVVWEKGKRDSSFPTIFGNGFILQYEDEDVFVTADHVIHKRDYEVGERTGKEYDYSLVNNIAGEGLSTMFTNIFGFNFTDSYDFGKYMLGQEDLDVAMIPYLEDYAVSFIGKSLPAPFMTHELILDEVKVAPHLPKLYLKQECIGLPQEGKKYLTMGVLHKRFNGVVWERENMCHFNIEYDREAMGMYKFLYYRPIIEDEWSGLSGAPFFDEDGHLIGMVIRVVDGENIIWVMPINKILNFIRITKQIEKLSTKA